MSVALGGGHIAALAGASRNDGDGGRPFKRSLDGVAHVVKRRVIDQPRVSDRNCGIVIPGLAVDRKTDLLQRLLQGRITRGRGTARAGRGIVEIIRARQHGADLLALCKRQRAVLVAQQHKSFALDFFRKRVESCFQVLIIAGIRAFLIVPAEIIIGGIVRIGDTRRIDAQHRVHRSALAHGDLITAGDKHEERGKDHRKSAPEFSVKQFFHVITPSPLILPTGKRDRDRRSGAQIQPRRQGRRPLRQIPVPADRTDPRRSQQRQRR